jgi:hypothetical protein
MGQVGALRSLAGESVDRSLPDINRGKEYPVSDGPAFN